MRNGRVERTKWAACRAALAVLAALIVAVACLAEVWPVSGDKVKSSSGLKVDYTNASEGYVIVTAPSGKKKLKLRFKCGGDQNTYDIQPGATEVYPLTLGNGEYNVYLFENKSGSKYAQKAQVSFKVKMDSEYAPYLCPSKYVWYTEDSPAVAKSRELCDGLKSDREKFDAIRNYMARNFTYDYVRALMQKTAYVGDVDGVFKSRSGLCQDLACIAACMLRVQGIPTQMAVGEATGTVGTIQHAWNYVQIGGEYIRLDVTADLQGYNNMVYTVEKTY